MKLFALILVALVMTFMVVSTVEAGKPSRPPVELLWEFWTPTPAACADATNHHERSYGGYLEPHSVFSTTETICAGATLGVAGGYQPGITIRAISPSGVVVDGVPNVDVKGNWIICDRNPEVGVWTIQILNSANVLRYGSIGIHAGDETHWAVFDPYC